MTLFNFQLSIHRCFGVYYGMNSKKQLVIWLPHDEVECFRFNEALLKKVKLSLPGMMVTLCSNSDEFKCALPNAYAVVVWVFKQEWFEFAPELRWLITPAAGKDYFKVSPPNNVKVHYCSFHGHIMAETVVAMMLAACRGLLPMALMQNDELWPKGKLQRIMRPFHGSHVMILGFGSIGTAVGRLSKALGARITGVKKHLSEVPDYFSDGDKVVLLDELDSSLLDVDHLVLCLPGIAETTNIIDEHRLSLLPNHVWIYNVGRGNAVDDDALVSALSSGRIGGACLDVFDEEPLPAESVLRNAPNLLLMPHASSISPEYMDLFIEELAELLTHDTSV